jgi:hypothetical protein
MSPYKDLHRSKTVIELYLHKVRLVDEYHIRVAHDHFNVPNVFRNKRLLRATGEKAGRSCKPDSRFC